MHRQEHRISLPYPRRAYHVRRSIASSEIFAPAGDIPWNRQMHITSACVQWVPCLLRHLLTYGSTNKYRPVKNCKASGSTATRPSEFVYFFCVTATPFTMMARVNTTDSQRWVCRIDWFQFNAISSEDEPEGDRGSPCQPS